MTAPEDFITTYLPDNPVMAYMWVGCLHWAIGYPDILAAFKADTGVSLTPARTPLDRMIDEATGADKAFIEAFVPWFHANVWGDELAEVDKAVHGTTRPRKRKEL
jgi:hypothetical protein